MRGRHQGGTQSRSHPPRPPSHTGRRDPCAETAASPTATPDAIATWLQTITTLPSRAQTLSSAASGAVVLRQRHARTRYEEPAAAVRICHDDAILTGGWVETRRAPARGPPRNAHTFVRPLSGSSGRRGRPSVFFFLLLLGRLFVLRGRCFAMRRQKRRGPPQVYRESPLRGPTLPRYARQWHRDARSQSFPRCRKPKTLMKKRVRRARGRRSASA